MSSSAANEELNKSDGSQSSGWVRFEEEDGGKIEVVATETGRNKNNPETSSVLSGEEYSGAVINTESPQVTLDRSSSRGDKQSDLTSRGVKLGPQQYSGAVISAETVHVNLDRSSLNRSMSEDPQHDLRSPSAKPQDSRVTMRTVDLREVSNGRPTTSNRVTTVDNAHIRQGFANGDIIVTLLPVNTRWPWITPAQFRPELVPEELMAQGLTLTVEDYVHVMEILTNDVRFNIYNVCYKRILVVWIFTAFVVLLGLLFSGVTGLTLFGLGVMWLVLNALAIFFCMWIKIKLNHNLERCMAQVNKHLIHHKIILGLDDRGKLSCHKVNLCFIYFDTVDCIKKLQEVIDREEREGRPVNREETPDERRQRQQFQQRMDIEDRDIIIQGSSTTRLSRKQARGEQLLSRYLQRWAKDYLRRRLDWTVDETGGNPVDPRHLARALCPCQYIEEYLKNKPHSDRRAFCPCWSSWLVERGIN
ncbi:transmembrane protein 268 isoform X2 [Anabrus simplex]|uniref:transmembrane protein 268 isoform X2 n=1 Tax=Anabrus simplex TaxID=316456 RepID=UPI0035A29F35